MNKKQVRICIIPTYQCQTVYEYYPFIKNVNDKTVLDLVRLDELLKSLKYSFDIQNIEIWCNELFNLSDFYIEMLYYLIKNYTKYIHITTNFDKINKGLLKVTDVINVQYNFNGYTKHKELIFENIKKVNKNKVINVKSLDISCEKDPLRIINDLNFLEIKSWEITPFNPGINSKLKANDCIYFEKVIKEYLFLNKQMKFAFQNKLQLDGILPIDNYNTDIVFITPQGKLAIQNFTKNNEFQLFDCDTLKDLNKKLEIFEKKRDSFCNTCNSNNRLCLANRYLNLNYQGKSCSGFKDLIEYYIK